MTSVNRTDGNHRILAHHFALFSPVVLKSATLTDSRLQCRQLVTLMRSLLPPLLYLTDHCDCSYLFHSSIVVGISEPLTKRLENEVRANLQIVQAVGKVWFSSSVFYKSSDTSDSILYLIQSAAVC